MKGKINVYKGYKTLGPVNLRPPTTVFLQATSAIKRRRGRPRRRALAGARACAQRVLCSALALALA